MPRSYFSFDGSRRSDAFAGIFHAYMNRDGQVYTVVDETHLWTNRNPFGFEATQCSICHAEVGECTHTGWDGKRSEHVYAERVGPPELTDGAVRPAAVLYTWPMIQRRAQGPLELQLYEAHRPHMREAGQLPRCRFCETIWPCENADEILAIHGLTEHDFDYRPEDNGAPLDL